MSFLFSYSSSPYYLSTAQIVDITRDIITGPEPTPILYKLTPSILPVGLQFNTSNGQITGTTNFTSIIPLTNYNVDASYNTAVASATFSLSVNFTPVFYYQNPITNFSNIYLLTENLYTDPIITPNYLISNSPSITYTLIAPNSDALADISLNLDSKTGIISGTPNKLVNPTIYTIQANNSGIFYDTTLIISVQNIPIIVYDNKVYTLTQNIPVNILPIDRSLYNVTYSISGCDLPFGLTFNTATGEITGIPTILTTFRTYEITVTNSIGYSTTSLTLNVIKEFLAPSVEADNFSSNTFLTNPVVAMRRKAEILQYKNNSSNLTKQQYLSLLAKGNGPHAKRAWGNQGNTNTNPNFNNFPQSGNTLICNTGIICSPTSSSDVPGPVINLCYNTNISAVGYNMPNKKRVDIGFKWPQKAWSPGDNGFPIGKAGSG
jgi:hypothetical protein